MGGYKYRVFLRKQPGLQNGVRLQGVSAYKGCPLGGVRLYLLFKIKRRDYFLECGQSRESDIYSWFLKFTTISMRIL